MSSSSTELTARSPADGHHPSRAQETSEQNLTSLPVSASRPTFAAASSSPGLAGLPEPRQAGAPPPPGLLANIHHHASTSLHYIHPLSIMPSDTSATSTYSAAFPLYKDADLVVQSSDGTLFATRALHLRSASSVFEDILGMPAAQDQEKKDGHSLIKVEEKADLVELFLSYAQRDRAPVSSAVVPSKPDWSTILLLSKMIEKYDAPLLGRSLFRDHLPRFIGNPYVREEAETLTMVSPAVFVLAVIHGVEDVARQALRSQQLWGKQEEGIKAMQHENPSLPDKVTAGWRPVGLGDVSEELVARLPAKYITRYCEIHDKVLVTPGYSWLKAGNDFKVSKDVGLVHIKTRRR